MAKKKLRKGTFWSYSKDGSRTPTPPPGYWWREIKGGAILTPVK